MRLSMRATNSINQFWWIVCWMLEENHDNDETYFDNVQIDELKTKYNDEKILSDIWWYMFEHFQHIDHILVSIELAEAKITKEKSYWCQNNIIVVRFICNYDSWHLKTAKIVKIVEWLLCINIIEAKAFIEICMYYWIWIKDFVIIAQFIYVLFKKSKAFIWKNSQIQAMKTFKLILTTASALKIIDYIEDTGKVICTVNVSRENWENNLMQVEQEEKKQHIICYENKIWSDVKKCYDVRK